jgi:hypothetical protein
LERLSAVERLPPSAWRSASLVGERLHRGSNDGRVFGLASRHDHVYGHHLTGEHAPARRDLALDRIGLAAEGVDLLARGRDDGKTVRPTSLEIGLYEVGP